MPSSQIHRYKQDNIWLIFMMIREIGGDRIRISDMTEMLACEKQCSKGHKPGLACAYSEAISVLSPIADAVHMVYGPFECATCAKYAWNARGSISSGKLYCSRRDSIFFFNERNPAHLLQDLAAANRPQAIFVYSTCLPGTDGNDIKAVCLSAAKDLRIPVIPVDFTGRQAKAGYEEACNALLRLIGSRNYEPKSPYSVNIIGDYNIAGDLWPIRSYFEEIGIEVIATITGDSKVSEIERAHMACLNLVSCSSSMGTLARKLEERYGTPSRRVSFLGIEDTSSAIRAVAEFFDNPAVIDESEGMISREKNRVMRQIGHYRSRLEKKRAAICLNSASKAASLTKALKELGMEVAVVGIRDGDWVDRQRIRNLIGQDAVDMDEIDESDLRDLLSRKGVRLVIPGIKEQHIARKLSVPFCDICHDRISIFEGFNGMVNFAREIDMAINSRTEKLPLRKRNRPGRPIAKIKM